jgi:hypothetical protein
LREFDLALEFTSFRKMKGKFLNNECKGLPLKLKKTLNLNSTTLVKTKNWPTLE